ncbi:DNA-directed RNA polymerase subunit beta [Paenibacillus peoriae]|uniref:DNA-directed RNA polymerase subunit beta n=1 Tax=Paenibacillus peoriae TaxID=59893 RepID=UPI00026C685D|nr:DNA-directed RNA polymerase subunit beta [Paenibacillus peoriae]MEC0183529.1 DNA-directed RNA polymerase subunit beta [Paenibacillus peoriae]
MKEEQSDPRSVPEKTKSRWRTARYSVVPLLLFISLLGGLIAGYVIVGKQGLAGVFEWKTWQHVIDLIFAP